MYHRHTTPLALLLAAGLLACISFIPPAAPAPESATAWPSWVSELPLQTDEQRWLAVAAVQVSAWMVDQAVAELRAQAEADALGTVPAPAASTPRGGLRARPLVPFYSFASAAPRPQES